MSMALPSLRKVAELRCVMERAARRPRELEAQRIIGAFGHRKPAAVRVELAHFVAARMQPRQWF